MKSPLLVQEGYHGGITDSLGVQTEASGVRVILIGAAAFPPFRQFFPQFPEKS
jgi:hypothetical protein